MMKRMFDLTTRTWKMCDEHGCCEGVPVFTAEFVRTIRNQSAVMLAKKYHVTPEIAAAWSALARKTYLELFDSKGSYKSADRRYNSVSDFEDEDRMEREAEAFQGYNLPPDCRERLKSLAKNR